MDWGGKVTALGTTTLNDREVTFGIKDADRVRHLSILGHLGSGRGALVVQMALQDIARGLGTLILDANGNVAPVLLERLPEGAAKRLIYLDPADAEYPYTWNPIDDVRRLAEAERVPFLADLLQEVYHVPPGAFATKCATLILAHDGTTLATPYFITVDEEWRKEFFTGNDAELAAFETVKSDNADAVKALEEYGKYVVKDTLVRNLIGQKKSKFTFEKLAEGGIVIVDFSRVRVFPTRMNPLVRIFVAAARAAARGGDTPIAVYLHDCLRYLDDAGIERAFTDSRIALTVADTMVQDADRERREKALARVGSVISFAAHPGDRSLIERAFYPYAGPDELTEMAKGEMIVALTIDAVRTKAFFAKSLALPERTVAGIQDFMVASRSTCTTPRTEVDGLFKLADKDERGPKDGNFSDAFKNIFAKRAGAAAGSAAPPPPERPAPAAPPSQEASEEKVDTKNEETKKPPEIAEEDLKALLYVIPVT